MTRIVSILRAAAFLATVMISGCAQPNMQIPRKSVAELSSAVPSLLNTLWVGAYEGTGKFSGHTFAYAFVFYKKPGDDTLLAKYADLGPLKVTVQNAKQISYEVRVYGKTREVDVISDERGSGYLISADGNVTFLARKVGSEQPALYMNRLLAGRDVGVHSEARQFEATSRELEFAKE